MPNPIKKAVRTVRESVRTRLWPVPTLGVIVALALGILVPRFDALHDKSLPLWLDGLVFNGDAGAARTVLDAISSSLITVTSLTFSLTVVTLQLASSQFSPRLLRTFTKDLFVQITLAIFLATFVFSLTALRSVRSSSSSGSGSVSDPALVPRIAVTVSFLFAIASVVSLVLFLAHLTRQIRVETMLANVHDDASDTIESTLPRLDDGPCPAAPERPGNAARIAVGQSGFLLRVDEERILETARSNDVVICIDSMPGGFIVSGTPVAAVWRMDHAALTEQQRNSAQRTIRRAVHVGPERTGAQDVGFGLRQLVDVANKALSPGINDPTTAVHALGHISALLSEIAQHRLGTVSAADKTGAVRAGFARPTFVDYLALALTQPRKYGSADALVVNRLLELLRDLAYTAPHEHAQAITEQLQLLLGVLTEQDFPENQRRQHSAIASDVLQILVANRPQLTE